MVEIPSLLNMESRFKEVKKEEIEKDGDLDSCSCSSIGKNSDDENENEDDDDEEVQSIFKCSKDRFDEIQALEEALPISKRGISRFYSGKSKSFTSLADASSSSPLIKEIAKPENAYSRKRKNLVAYKILWGDKNPNFQLKSSSNNLGGTGRISKKFPNSSATTAATSLALAVAINNTVDSSKSNSNLNPISQCNGSLRNFSVWRSFSLADLQQCTTAPPPR